MGIPRFLNRGINIPVGKGGWEPGEGLGGGVGIPKSSFPGDPKVLSPFRIGDPKTPIPQGIPDPKVLDPFRTGGPRALIP